MLYRFLCHVLSYSILLTASILFLAVVIPKTGSVHTIQLIVSKPAYGVHIIRKLFYTILTILPFFLVVTEFVFGNLCGFVNHFNISLFKDIRCRVGSAADGEIRLVPEVVVFGPEKQL